MIRAIFFDFYSVWVPDIFTEYLNLAEQRGPEVAGKLEAVVEQYFRGTISIEEVAGAFRYQLSRPDIDNNLFVLRANDISPSLTDFMRNLHGHFVKLGVLANLGQQEYQILTDFNNRTQLLEVIAGPLPLQLQSPLLSNEVFAKALQAIGEPPASCLVVTGNTAYQAFAASIGMDTLLFEGFPKLQQTLEQVLTSEVP